MAALKPNSKRALNTILLLWVDLGVTCLSLISNTFQYILLRRSAKGNPFDQSIADAAELASNLLGIIAFITMVFTAVFFIMWFRRAYNNLHQFDFNLSYNEAWAAGAWFVPILNLFRPYQIMKEMYNQADLVLTRSNSIGNNLRSAHVGWWWAFWIATSVLGQIIFRLSFRSVTSGSLKSLALVNLIDSIVTVFLTILAIKVVRDYAYIEPELVTIHEQAEKDAKDDASIFTPSEYRRYLDATD